jgi:hypothetical protein
MVSFAQAGIGMVVMVVVVLTVVVVVVVVVVAMTVGGVIPVLRSRSRSTFGSVVSTGVPTHWKFSDKIKQGRVGW